MKKLILSLAALAVAAPSATFAQSAVAEASIPFADHGGIRNWRVEDNDTVYIQGNGNKWYRAELMVPCTDLPFVDAAGFKSNPDGSFDRFSSISTRGRECPLKSLTASGPPPKKHDKKHG